MRKKLAAIDGTRATFTGTFERLGTKSSYGYEKQTVLLKDIKNHDGELVTDHLWFNLTKGIESLNLAQGDIVQFDARVKKYLKGYRGHREDVYSHVEKDYKLSHPTRLTILVKAGVKNVITDEAGSSTDSEEHETSKEFNSDNSHIVSPITINGIHKGMYDIIAQRIKPNTIIHVQINCPNCHRQQVMNLPTSNKQSYRYPLKCSKCNKRIVVQIDHLQHRDDFKVFPVKEFDIDYAEEAK